MWYATESHSHLDVRLTQSSEIQLGRVCIIKSPVGIVHACRVECYEVEAFQSSQEPQELLGFTKTYQHTSENMD